MERISGTIGMHSATRSPGVEAERAQSVGHAIGFAPQTSREGERARGAVLAFPDAGDAIRCPPSGPGNCARC